MIAVHDVGKSEPIDRRVQGFDAEVGLQRVRYPPRQNHPGMPVHDCHQIEEPATHRQIGDVHAPDPAWPAHTQPAQQIGVSLVPASRLAPLSHMHACVRGQRDVGVLVGRHEAHQPHEPADALLVHRMAFVGKVPRHLANAEEQRLQKLHVYQPHEVEILLRLTLRHVIERRSRDL